MQITYKCAISLIINIHVPTKGRSAIIITTHFVNDFTFSKWTKWSPERGTMAKPFCQTGLDLNCLHLIKKISCHKFLPMLLSTGKFRWPESDMVRKRPVTTFLGKKF